MVDNKHPKWTTERIKTLRNFVEAGKSAEFMASHFEIKENNLRQILHLNKIYIKSKQSGKDGQLQKLRRKQKQKSIDVRLSQLQGLIPYEDIKAKTFFSDDELKSWIGKPDTFLQGVLGVELQDFQNDIFDLFSKHKRIAIAGGRGVSKSFCASLWLIYTSIMRPNQRSLIVSPSDRQSKLIFEQIQRFLAENEELFNCINLKKSNMERITFENESEIIPLPSSAYIRGFQNVALVLCDESAFFSDDEMIFSAIMPMLNLRNKKTGEYGALILLSSPNGTNNKFFEFFHNPLFKTMKVPSIMNKYLDKDKLEQDKLIMNPVQYESEYLCEFMESVSNFFTTELIARCTKSYPMLNFPDIHRSYYLGWDTASSGRDSSVLTTIEVNNEGHLKVVNITELQKQNLPQQVKAFEMLNEKFNYRGIGIEKAGFGEAIIDSLVEKKHNVKVIVPSVDEKATIFNRLLKIMDEGRLTIPNNPKLQSQMKMFRYALSKTGKLMLHHSSEMIGDDFVDSLAFCNWVAVQGGEEYETIEYDDSFIFGSSYTS